MTRVLRGHGFEVETAGEAEEGWRRYEQSQFDVVVLDIVMPGQDASCAKPSAAAIPSRPC